MAKIYTKTGDLGETSFYGGKRVPKHDLRLDVYGTLDELNSLIGVARASSKSIELEKLFIRLQRDLFVVGSDIASPETHKIERVSEGMVKRLEGEIDKLDAQLPPLHNFILPSGVKSAALLQFARAVCRRAERRLVELNAKEKANPQLIVYMNRLSDLLFVLARYENKLSGKKDEEWKV